MNHNNYRNPVSWVPSVYFAMGLPFIAVNLVSTFMFKDLGISDTQIAFWTSIIMMPWTLKFLWSPFLEMYRTKKFFVVITQLLSGLLFGLVAFSLKFDYFFAISISTMAVIAFSGATHDIACDGVYMAELSPADQAKYIGVQGLSTTSPNWWRTADWWRWRVCWPRVSGRWKAVLCRRTCLLIRKRG